MSRRDAAIRALALTVASVVLGAPHTALAKPRHVSAFGGREAGVGLGIGIGHPLPTSHAQSTLRLTIPAPGAIRERQPATKPTRDPFPDFSVPLRRHRMAMPDSAIPALGDLSF